MNLLTRLTGGIRDITSLEDYAAALNQFGYGGIGYGYGYGGGLSTGIVQTLSGRPTELAPNNFVGLASAAYASNGVVFACMLVRQLLFSSIRFRWQTLRDGKPSKLFGTTDLQLLERPWVGGTTQDLLSRIIQDADLAGNSYWVRAGNELVRLRPDWVDLVLVERQMPDGRGQIGWSKWGYLYTEGGRGNDKFVALLTDEVAHFAPIPDPLGFHIGMSWLTPILREIRADQSMTRHQRKFFDNAATVNMVIRHPEAATPEKVESFADRMQKKFGGVENAYKNLHLYPGADVTVVGSNLKDIDFANVREGGEVRIAAAAGVPPVIVGLSKGLDSATYSNYGLARRRLADGTGHPLWQNLAGTMEQIIPRPPGSNSRLWYDTSDVPFLREDEKDAATIQQIRAATINSLITSGFKKDSVVAAVESGDFGLLEDTGLVSVQLLPPGTSADTQSPTNGQIPVSGRAT